MTPYSIESIRQKFVYHPNTGLVTSRIKTIKSEPGDTIGYVGVNGYAYVYFQKKCLLVHRLGWAYIHGYWPKALDHIDGNPLNNCLSNLREADQLVNCKNQRKKASRSGVTGVFWRPERAQWVAYIKVNYKRKHLGSFATKEEAIRAREAANVQYGFHPNHGHR